MPIRFFIKQWLMPPGILFLLLLAAWWWRARRPRLAALCFGVGLGGLWCGSRWSCCSPATRAWSRPRRSPPRPRGTDAARVGR